LRCGSIGSGWDTKGQEEVLVWGVAQWHCSCRGAESRMELRLGGGGEGGVGEQCLELWCEGEARHNRTKH